MKRTLRLSIWLLLAIVGVGFAGGAGEAEAPWPVDEMIYSAMDRTVRIELVSGHLTVRGWHQPNVLVTGLAGRLVSEVDLSVEEGGTVTTVVVDTAEQMRMCCAAEQFADVEHLDPRLR